MKLKILAATAAISIITGVLAAYAHTGATGVYKERMDAMGDMGDVVKRLSAMMRGETAYDADAVKAGAKTIRSHAGSTMTGLFPEGSAHPPSEAKPEIWSDWDAFTALANQLETFAQGLEGAADNGLAMQGGMGGGSMMGSGGMMGGQGMMGSGSMMGGGGMMSAEHLAQMPADGVFNMLTQTCSACHTRFRVEKN